MPKTLSSTENHTLQTHKKPRIIENKITQLNTSTVQFTKQWRESPPIYG
jgi:hypothetical protein